MHLEYADEAADKLDFYDDNDVALARAFDRVLGELEANPHAAKARQTYLRPPGAYVLEVRVPGRDENYYVFWQFEEPDVVFIKYAGPAKARHGLSSPGALWPVRRT